VNLIFRLPGIYYVPLVGSGLRQAQISISRPAMKV
jgi:hypothetical protein